MKKTVLLVSLVLFTTALVQAQDGPSAEELVRSSRDRIKAGTISTRSRLLITAKNGGVTERLIDQYSKDDAQGNSRMVIVFQRPPAVAGTRFLTIDKSGGGSDQWIYLPELRRLRRIAASEGGGSFMGTDMSYDDVAAAGRSADADTHTLLREESYGGADCYVIQSVPKDGSYQYSKLVSWIGKGSYLNYKTELYDRRGTLVKTMESSDFQDIQGRLTAMQTKVSTLAAGTFTTIFVDIIKYDDPIPETVFTTQYLETGRAR